MALPGPFRGATKGQALFAISAGAVAATGAAIVLAMSGANEKAPTDEPTVASASAERRAYAVAPFQEITSVGPQTIVVALGDEYSVRAEGRLETLERIEVLVENRELVIRPKRRVGRSGGRATFYVTMPRLESASLAGSGDMRIERVEGERFSGSIAGSGEMAIGTLEVDEADLSIAGSGDVVASGTARISRISITGSGDVRARGLNSEVVSVSILGSGDAALTAEREARISIMGRGDVDIAGEARCSVTRMGRGDVRCANID